jgi:hypothetical protein
MKNEIIITPINEEFVKEKSKQNTFIENKEIIWNWSSGVIKNIIFLKLKIKASFLMWVFFQ